MAMLESVMKHKWWRRLWTFQEFVIARRPIFVMGQMKVSWTDFENALPFLMATSDAEEETNKSAWLQARKSATISKLIPEGLEDPAGMESFIHRYPTLLEARDAFLCRKAYQDRNERGMNPVFTGYFLLKTRNRKASNNSDKLYGLYHLLQASG